MFLNVKASHTLLGIMIDQVNEVQIENSTYPGKNF